MAPLSYLVSFKVVSFDLLSRAVLKAKRIVTALDFERETCLISDSEDVTRLVWELSISPYWDTWWVNILRDLYRMSRGRRLLRRSARKHFTLKQYDLSFCCKGGSHVS
jgi:hypothetical protein